MRLMSGTAEGVCVLFAGLVFDVLPTYLAAKVAARMLGSWTSYALRYIGHWDTRVVDDYLHTYCPKVILQVLLNVYPFW